MISPGRPKNPANSSSHPMRRPKRTFCVRPRNRLRPRGRICTMKHGWPLKRITNNGPGVKMLPAPHPNPLGGNPNRKKVSRKDMVSTVEQGEGIVAIGVEVNTISRLNVRCDRRINPLLRLRRLPPFPARLFPRSLWKIRRPHRNQWNIPLPLPCRWDAPFLCQR